MLSSIAKSLALASVASAATYSNSSFVPSGSGFFYDGQVYFDIILPNSGFSSFSITAGSGNGFSYAPDSLSGVYSPSGTPFEITSDSTTESIDISADVDFSTDDKYAEVAISGPTSSESDALVGIFVISLEGLPHIIEKRADQDFTITVTATSSVPSWATTGSSTTGSGSGSGSVTTTNTATETSTSTETITSCSDDKCETLTPVNPTATHTATETTVVTITSCSDNKCHESTVTTGVTVVTENETVYTTYCPLTDVEADKTVSETKTVTTTVCETTEGTTITKSVTYTTTECSYYDVVKPTTVIPSTSVSVNPSVESEYEGAAATAPTATPALPTTVVPSTSVSVNPPVESEYQGAAATNFAGSLFGLATVFLAMLL